MWPNLLEISPAAAAGPKRRRAAARSSKGTAHIRHFATHPDHLRQGVARALIERCGADARERRVSQFKCMSSLPAEGFYARLGFRRVGRADFALPGGIRLAAVVMERDVG